MDNNQLQEIKDRLEVPRGASRTGTQNGKPSRKNI